MKRTISQRAHIFPPAQPLKKAKTDDREKLTSVYSDCKSPEKDATNLFMAEKFLEAFERNKNISCFYVLDAEKMQTTKQILTTFRENKIAPNFVIRCFQIDKRTFIKMEQRKRELYTLFPEYVGCLTVHLTSIKNAHLNALVENDIYYETISGIYFDFCGSSADAKIAAETINNLRLIEKGRTVLGFTFTARSGNRSYESRVLRKKQKPFAVVNTHIRTRILSPTMRKLFPHATFKKSSIHLANRKDNSYSYRRHYSDGRGSPMFFSFYKLN